MPRTASIRSLKTLGMDWWLVVLLGIAFTWFAIALPDTFPTTFNLKLILSSNSVVALTAFAVLIPLAANQFDLSVGYVVGLTSILSVGLQTRAEVNWPVTVAIVLIAGTTIGLVNGILVAYLRVHSFVATLGTGTIVYGLSGWYSGGNQVLGTLPSGFTEIASSVSGVPLPAVIALVFAIVLWLILEYLPIGRHLYVTGASPRAAELIGVPVSQYVIGAFMASGFITAAGGVVLAAQLQVAQPSTGPSYLLPAFAAALLGSTAFGKRRVNVWGALVAILLLAVIVSGLQQLDAKFYIQPLVNGSILVVAVSLAGISSRRRKSRFDVLMKDAGKGPSSKEPLGAPSDAGSDPGTR